MKKFQIAQAGYIVISIAFYAGAILFLCGQWLPAPLLCIFCGVCLLAYGVIKIIGYFSEDLFCLLRRKLLVLFRSLWWIPKASPAARGSWSWRVPGWQRGGSPRRKLPPGWWSSGSGWMS